MRSSKKKLLLPLLAAVIALGATQAAMAGDDEYCEYPPVTNPTERVPDGGATALLLIGAGVGMETLRKRFNRS